MRLSKITETKKGRMALFGEADEFLFSVDAETYYKYGLCEGCELDAAALARFAGGQRDAPRQR